MALCLATSLLERGRFDPVDQMERYVRWADTGYLSSNGTCFDIGLTISQALRRFRETGEPFSGSTHPLSAGNGSIMRLAPIPLFFFPDLDAIERYSAESSRTTHGAAECVDACRLFGRIIYRALLGRSKKEVAFGDRASFAGEEKIAAIARGSYIEKPEEAIRGSGYVVQSLEAAMWCFMQTDSYEEAILRAVNLGDDADTTAAVCGQVAGAFYGQSGIPARWLDRLTQRAEITRLADQMVERGGPSSPTHS